MLAPRRSIVIDSGNIDKASCPFEEFVANAFGKIFPWMGEFRLEEKSKPVVMFKSQINFESVIQTRIYRLWKNNLPTRCCIRFTYDTSNKEYMASWRKESRDYMAGLGNTIFTVAPKTDVVLTFDPKQPVKPQPQAPQPETGAVV